MPWKHYRLVFRLESPLHIGWRKAGNLMQTRRYVPARTLFGAWVAALTRAVWPPPWNACQYRQMESFVQENFRVTYLWPAASKDAVSFPWENPERFDYRFLDAYASTAVAPEGDTAEEGSLHQVEYISPWTRQVFPVPSQNPDRQEDPSPVYLLGDLWIRSAVKNIPPKADSYKLKTPEDLWNLLAHLRGLQLGGERTYGWGKVRLVQREPREGTAEGECLFLSKDWVWRVEKDEVVVESRTGEAWTLAHALPGSCPLAAQVEPLTAYRFGEKGFSLEMSAVAYGPGARVPQGRRFRIRGGDGLWVPV